jgi:parallel beta-helix repeat protein
MTKNRTLLEKPFLVCSQATYGGRPVKLLMTVIFMVSLASCARNAMTQTIGDTPFASLEPQTTGTTYYVSGEGDDANSGLSTESAFRTLQKAADQTQPGDQVLVMNGTYTKAGPLTNVLDIRNAGTSEGYIIYKAYEGQTPLIKVDNNYAGIYISVPYIVIDGFTVEGNLPNLSFEEADALAKGTDKETTLNSKFNSNGIASFPRGDNPSLLHHLIIRNNTVFNNPAAGIFSNGSDYIRIENNIVYNNSYYSPYANSGISFYQSREIDTSTGAKMFVRNNIIYKNENKVPFWFSNEADPSKRVITDGNGVIIDDSRNTQVFVSGGGTPYQGQFVVENNLIYDNGGRGVNIFESDNVVVQNNTLYQNGRTPGFTELGIGEASNVQFLANIFSVSPERKPILSYSSSSITFDNNLFFGGSETTQFPPSTTKNLIKNGDFSADLNNWQLVTGTNAGAAENTRDSFNRNCVYVDKANLPNSFDVYLMQGDLNIKKGYTYTLTFDVTTSNKTKADFVLKVGGSSGSFTAYFLETVSLPVNTTTTYPQSLSFTMTNEADSAAQLEFQVAGNPESSYFCFDNVVLSESSNILGQDPKFVNANTDPSVADFHLQQTSPAVNAQFVTVPSKDLENTARPKGTAADLGAYESF